MSKIIGMPLFGVNIVTSCLTKLSAKMRAESLYQFSPMAERSVALGIWGLWNCGFGVVNCGL